LTAEVRGQNQGIGVGGPAEQPVTGGAGLVEVDAEAAAVVGPSLLAGFQ
jgi:hypothetical protein